MKQDWKPGTMIYPLPAALVSCGSKEEEYNILTVAWVGTICSNPPMCYISVRPERYSYSILKKNMEFVINLTTENMAFATDWCGVRSGKDHNKFAEMKLTPGKDIPFINAIELMNLKSKDETLTVKTFEISTEYIKFYSDKVLTVGDTFDCELLLPKDYGTIIFKITLTENDPVYDNEYTAVYSMMSEENRQALLYYMYLYSNNSD